MSLPEEFLVVQDLVLYLNNNHYYLLACKKKEVLLLVTRIFEPHFGEE